MKPNRYPGKFIVFEGLDAAGKTTVAKELLHLYGNSLNIDYLKGVGSDNRWGKLARRYAKTFLFLLELIIVTQFPLRSNLRRGRNVLMDKYFAFVASHIPDVNSRFNRMLIWVVEKLMIKPDLIVYFDVSLEERLERLKKGPYNRFHEKLIANPRLIFERNFVYRNMLQGENIIFFDTTCMQVGLAVMYCKNLLWGFIKKGEIHPWSGKA